MVPISAYSPSLFPSTSQTLVSTEVPTMAPVTIPTPPIFAPPGFGGGSGTGGSGGGGFGGGTGYRYKRHEAAIFQAFRPMRLQQPQQPQQPVSRKQKTQGAQMFRGQLFKPILFGQREQQTQNEFTQEIQRPKLGQIKPMKLYKLPKEKKSRKAK
jgi:hypothetical protein